MSSKYTPQPYKVIFQIRYEPILRFYKRLFDLAEKLGADFPQWETTGLRIIMSDYEHRCSVNLKNQSITYEQDCLNETLEFERIDRVIAATLDTLGIEDYRRFGYRRVYLAKTNMEFADLVDICDLKWFSQRERFLQGIPGQKNDLAFQMATEGSQFRYNLAMSPISLEQLLKTFINKERHLPDNGNTIELQALADEYPHVSMLTDIDVYQNAEPIPSTKTDNLREAALEQSRAAAQALTNYVFEKEA